MVEFLYLFLWASFSTPPLSPVLNQSGCVFFLLLIFEYFVIIRRNVNTFLLWLWFRCSVLSLQSVWYWWDHSLNILSYYYLLQPAIFAILHSCNPAKIIHWVNKAGINMRAAEVWPKPTCFFFYLIMTLCNHERMRDRDDEQAQPGWPPVHHDNEL